MLNFAVSLSQTQQFNIQNYKFNILLNSFLYSPYEGAEAEFGSLGIELSQLLEHGGHAAVLDHGHYGACQRGPGMAAVVRFAVDAATPFDLLPRGEATAVAALEHFDYAFVVCLVVGDKYGFHRFIF